MLEITSSCESRWRDAAAVVAPVTGTGWFVYGVRGGKLVTIDMFATRDQALEAVGSSEHGISA